jgi:hypothetical protein
MARAQPQASSHPGAARVPTDSLDGVHPTPHVPLSDPPAFGIPAFGESSASTLSLTSTTSLGASTGGESGYAASSERANACRVCIRGRGRAR